MWYRHVQGQEAAVTTLHNAVARARLAHAYVFIGPAGVGKKKTARALGQAILCQEQSQQGCDACAACVAVLAGTHPDLLGLAPEAEKRSLVIDQVRELQRLLVLKSAFGGKKIVILDEAHLLTTQAQSALLKLVEEPPGDALLILLTINAAALSRPLLSRCQQVRFAALPLPVVEALLVRDHGKDAAVARALALHSRGSMGRALALDPEVFLEESQYVEEELQKLQRASFTDLSRFAEWLAADRVRNASANSEGDTSRPTGDRLELVLSWYEEVLRCAVLGQEGIVRYRDRSSAVSQLAAAFGVQGALRRLALVYDTLQALGRNANRRLAVEDMLVQLAEAR